ncbi:unnamed protein product [Boreogadus saida]
MRLLAPGDGHLACSVCLGTDHAEAAMAAPVSSVACRELPEEGILSRHLFFSPAVDLTRWHHRRRRRRLHGRRLGVRFFPLSGYNRHRRGEIMGEAAAIKGFPMPAPPLAPVSDDMQGECFRTPCFPAGYPVPLVPACAALVYCCRWGPFYPEGSGRPTARRKPRDGWRFPAFSSAILQLCQPIAVSAGRHMAWATMIQRVIWLSHNAVQERERASLVQGPLAPDGLFGPRFSEVLAHQQSVRENRSRFGAILTGSSHQQAGRRRGPGRSQRSRGPPPTPAPVPQQPPQTGRAAPRTVGWRSDGVFTWPRFTCF